MQVKQMESMRRNLPENVSMVITKNRLLRVAVDNLEDEGQRAAWEGLKGQKGMNAYVFAPEEDIRGAVKAFSGLLTDLQVCTSLQLIMRMHANHKSPLSAVARLQLP